MKFTLGLLATAFTIVTVGTSLPAHAAVSSSTVENILQKMVDTFLPTQTTELENIDREANATTELTPYPETIQITEPEYVDPEANDFSTDTKDAIDAPTEETIVSGDVSFIANENCFSVEPANSAPFPLSGTPEQILPSDEDPTADDEGFPAFPGWDELLQRLKDLEIQPIDVETNAT